MSKSPKQEQPEIGADQKKRSRVEQSDVPSMSLTAALRVPQAIFDNYAGGPVNAIQLAQALNMTPSSGSFRMLCGASIAYGLTNGGYNAGQIIVEPLAKRIFRPLEENDDAAARREAFLKPRIISEFLTKYNGHAIPAPNIARNVLGTLGVPEDRCSAVLDMIIEGAEFLNLITTIKDKKYVQLGNALVSAERSSTGGAPAANESLDEDNYNGHVSETRITTPPKPPASTDAPAINIQERNNKVFVTHGKNKSFVEPIKQLLVFGKFEPIVAVERQSTSKPVPDKVMDDMRGCSAAIIHVDAEQTLQDAEGNQHNILNPNVLIEIGAALALYGKRFILLVREGVKLPSNLQGLYEVRYNGENLTAQETIALLTAINTMNAG
jgi:predicted nucleotide-binding protein